MKKQFLSIFIIGAMSAVILSGCKSSDSSAEKGLLAVSAYNSEEIVISGSSKTATKSSSQASDDYQVNISQMLSGEVMYSANYGNVKLSPLAIEQGVYRVSAQNIGISDAQWDAPRYAGIKEVTVKAGQQSAVNIECHMTNTKVSVEVTELLNSVFDVRSVIVSSENGGELEYLGNAGKAGYFRPSKLNATVVVSRKSDGKEKTMTIPIADAYAAIWYKVKLSLKLFANMDFGITLESDVVEIYDTEVNPLD